MPLRRLRVIPTPEPRTRLVLIVPPGGAQGDGELDLLCGLCDAILARGLPDENLDAFRAALVAHFLRRGSVGISSAYKSLVIRCPACDSYNEVVSAPRP